MQNTMTEVEAVRRAEEHVQRAMGALPAEAYLEVDSPTSSFSCSDPSDRGPLGRVVVDNVYRVRGLPAEGYGKYFDAMARWWTEHGFVILLDMRSENGYWVSAESKDDAFRMAFRDNFKGDLFLGASSPCVWPNGTPEPKSR